MSMRVRPIFIFDGASGSRNTSPRTKRIISTMFSTKNVFGWMVVKVGLMIVKGIFALSS